MHRNARVEAKKIRDVFGDESKTLLLLDDQKMEPKQLNKDCLTYKTEN